MSCIVVVLIAFAGSVGAVSRFMSDGFIRDRYNQNFPWATLLINISGSFLLGTAEGVVLKHEGLKDIISIIGIGFCGGYTTFSTASFESVRLFEEHRFKAAYAYVACSLLITVVAATVGLIIGECL